MQRARAFFYVSLGILALVVAFHLGASTGNAQGGLGTAAGIASDGSKPWVVATNGDVYTRNGNPGDSWVFFGNVFSGSPVPSQVQTWGRIKADRR